MEVELDIPKAVEARETDELVLAVLLSPQTIGFILDDELG